MWRGSACVAGAVQETHESDMLEGPRADFVRGVAFWSIRSSGLLRWFCMTGALSRMSWPHFLVAAEYFRQMERKNRKTYWYEAVSFALNFPFLKEVSQNCFVFYVARFENWGSLAELLCFWCGQLEKLRKSRRIAAFLTLSSSKVKDVSQNCCVLMLSSLKTEEVSQNSLVFKLEDR